MTTKISITIIYANPVRFAWFFIDFGISGCEGFSPARAQIYGPAVGAVIGIIIKWTKDIVEKISTRNNKNGSSADKNKVDMR